jgi:penicillin-binding protein 1C
MILLLYYFSLPRTLFQEPYSTVIESKEGELLGAKIARDGQWRFPAQDSVPYKFKKCIVYFEDEYFITIQVLIQLLWLMLSNKTEKREE